jgi:hypothetical protein
MNCGDPTIDGLLNNEGHAPPLAPGANGVAVSYLQDLLRGHGYDSLPDPRVTGYGTFGQVTSKAVAAYRQKYGFPGGNVVDSRMLSDVVSRLASAAVAGPAYAPLVLNAPFTPIARFVWLTSLFETRGAFALLNLNSDRCGLSLGILQWSQKANQLHALLNACCRREPHAWVQVMGTAGDGLLNHIAKPNGGLDALGWSLDPAFELSRDPWKGRFEALGASPGMQRVQLDLATETFAAGLKRARQYAFAIHSERGFAFLLDMANQFGAGRVAQQYAAHAVSGDSEAAILVKLEDAFTNLANPAFQPQVHARREFFRTTTLLSDAALDL